MSAHHADVVIGWDVGWAHLKAAQLSADRQLQQVDQEPCPLWQGLSHLHAALDAVLHGSQMRGAVAHAITMTGESADLFVDRAEGVRTLVDLMSQRLGKRRTGFYAGQAGWLAATGAKAEPALVASANWHASSLALAQRMAGSALFIDVGSTTTDIVPIGGGRVLARSWGDRERMVQGELVYTGVVRTPLMALARAIPVHGRMTPLMAEMFATTADVYRILGWLPAEADQQDSVDGAPKTSEASRRRLARMVGCDAQAEPDSVWNAVAKWFADAQLTELERACRQVMARCSLPEAAPIIAAGIGSFVAERLAHRLGRQVWPYAAALGLAGQADIHWASRCAPAVGVALLYLEHMP